MGSPSQESSEMYTGTNIKITSIDDEEQMDEFLNQYKEEQIKVQDTIDDEPEEDLFFSFNEESEIGLSDYELKKSSDDLFAEKDDDVFDPFADV